MRASPPRIPAQLRQILDMELTERTTIERIRAEQWTVTKLGTGSFRTAYCITLDSGRELVIKRRQPPLGFTPYRGTRVALAPSAYVGCWEVQHYYPPCPPRGYAWVSRISSDDIKPSNVGLDTDGTVVCFDSTA